MKITPSNTPSTQASSFTRARSSVLALVLGTVLTASAISLVQAQTATVEGAASGPSAASTPSTPSAAPSSAAERSERGAAARWHRHGPGVERTADKARDPMTRAEFEAMHRRWLDDRLKRFDAADTDQDGVLSQAERKALRAEMRQSRHHGRHAQRDECRRGASPAQG